MLLIELLQKYARRENPDKDGKKEDDHLKDDEGKHETRKNEKGEKR